MSEAEQKVESVEFPEIVELAEPVALAGAAPRQLTGQEAGRVVGFGCDD